VSGHAHACGSVRDGTCVWVLCVYRAGLGILAKRVVQQQARLVRPVRGGGHQEPADPAKYGKFLLPHVADSHKKVAHVRPLFPHNGSRGSSVSALPTNGRPVGRGRRELADAPDRHAPSPGTGAVAASVRMSLTAMLLLPWQAMGTVCWFWILYRGYHDMPHLLGYHQFYGTGTWDH